MKDSDSPLNAPLGWIEQGAVQYSFGPGTQKNMKTQMQKLFSIFLALIVIVFCIGWLDWRTGFELNFFVFYFIPVGIAAWSFGVECSIVFAIICALVWAVVDKISGHNYSSMGVFLWNTLIRLISFLLIGYYTSKVFSLLRSEKVKTARLQKALAEIEVLESLLYICCICKRICDEDGNWKHLESYIEEHSGMEYPLGYCPECTIKSIKGSS